MWRLKSPLTWVLVAIAVLYGLTLYPGVGGRINGGDSAKFQFIGMIGGISHPPGNPLYMIFNALWAHLPWPCSPALRANLLSMFFGLLTLGVLAHAVSRSFGEHAALCAVIVLALGPLFWTLSTEAEVYSLNAALVAASLASALAFERSGQRLPLLLCAAFALLGCANHLTSAMLLPAAAYMLWRAHRQSIRLRARELAGLLAVGVLSMVAYAYIPLRAHFIVPYSEWLEGPGLVGFLRYVTAARFQSGILHLTPTQLVLERLPVIASQLQQQWAWPVLLLLPHGFTRMHERSALATRFVQIALLGLVAFALVYKIPDPAGFYIPIVTLLALPLALACMARDKYQTLRLGVLASCLAVSAWQHASSARSVIGHELVYNFAGHKGVAWDLDDLFNRIPEGASFAQPCEAYGCVQLINYYRFGDQTAQRRKIHFVQLPGIDSMHYAYAPMEVVPWRAGAERVVCTLQKGDAKRLARSGAGLQTIDRQGRRIDDKDYPGVPIYCTEPARADSARR